MLVVGWDAARYRRNRMHSMPSKLTKRTAAEQKLFILWPIAYFSRSFSLLENRVKCGADAVAAVAS